MPTHDPVSLTGIYDVVEVVDDVLAGRAVERGVVRPGRVGAWCLVAQGELFFQARIAGSTSRIGWTMYHVLRIAVPLKLEF